MAQAHCSEAPVLGCARCEALQAEKRSLAEECRVALGDRAELEHTLASEQAAKALAAFSAEVRAAAVVSFREGKAVT